jgi:hypothetical protein
VVIASPSILVASPALARRGDYILASQIEDESVTIRASVNGRALGGPTDVLLWRDAGGQWREFRPVEYWMMRTR